jgi:uncharacterized membrane protein YdfJ with MMPL/SSD domain
MPEPMSGREYTRRSVLSRGTVAAGAANVGAVTLCACPVAEMLARHQYGLPFVSGWLIVDALMFAAGIVLMAAGYWTLIQCNRRLWQEYGEGRR